MIKKTLNNFSIKRINFILFFLMFFNYTLISISNNSIFLKYLIFILNIIYLIVFLVFNYFYTKEFEENKRNIKNLIKNDSDNNKILKINNIYSENKDTHNLFKSIIINKNILKKDYVDLEKILFKFTPEFYLEEIFKKGIDRVKVGITVEKFIHVMFLDIIGFTSITEKLSPERALLLLNIYFDWIIEIIRKHDWFVDKFLWDWILIVFTEHDSEKMIKASIEIQKYIKNFRISDIWKSITIWIGINSGNVIIWTVGSKERMEVTIIWDIVNTASRIENLTRKFKEKIIISESTYKCISNNKNFNTKYLWEKVLKWKRKKVRIYWVEEIINLDLE